MFKILLNEKEASPETPPDSRVECADKEYVNRKFKELDKEIHSIYAMISSLCRIVRVADEVNKPVPKHQADRAADRNFITIFDKDGKFSHYVYRVKTEEE